jgi:hypothetical protein
MKLFNLVLGGVLASAALAFAQAEPHQHVAEKLGRVNFETSCAARARGDFNRAVALLHSFEFSAAIETFNKVLAADPQCAMAYWGIALSHWANPFAGIKTGPLLERGLAAVQKGLATGNPTVRERAYLSAVSELYKNVVTLSHRDRTLAYAKAMEAVQQEYRTDIEARIFYALAIDQTALPTDKTYALQLQAAEILAPLWKQYPDHPGLAHYIIHAYDHPPLAAKALTAARRYASIAPAAPHALHMPSHTFTRVGLWQESVDTNIRSEQESVRQGAIAEALHAMDYQAYAYLQMAQDAKAKVLLDRMPGIARNLDLTVFKGAAPPVAGAYGRSAIAARYALERGAWAEAAALEPIPTPFSYPEAVTYFARALGAARSQRPAAAAADVEKLISLRDALTAAKDEYWAGQVEIQRQIAIAWITFAEGKKDDGVRLMRAASDAEDATDKAAVSPGPIMPARELLGEMLLEAGNAKEALAAFTSSIQKEPNRFRGAYGAARAAEALGDRALAVKYYRQLVTIAASSDNQRPELKRARAYAQ